VLRYEDMKHDLATHIRRLGTFLGRPLSPQAVAAIAEYGSFASVSMNPFTNREADPMMNFSIARFLRKGEVGDWRTHFTAEQNARFIAVWEQQTGGTTLHRYFSMEV
jgi:sulfotransferase